MLVELNAQSKCDEPVRRAVWRTLDKEILSSNPLDCRSVLEAKPVKLSASSANTFVVRGSGLPYCGATGNCSTWIIKRRGRRYEVILNAGSVIKSLEITKRSSNKYSDLIFRGWMGASEHYVGRYRFDGTKYRLNRCTLEAYSADGIRSTSKADRTFCQ